MYCCLVEMSKKLNNLITQKDQAQLQEFVRETSTEEVRNAIHKYKTHFFFIYIPILYEIKLRFFLRILI